VGHVHVGLMEFIVWVGYFVIFKALMHVINIETRRAGLHIPAGVSGLLA